MNGYRYGFERDGEVITQYNDPTSRRSSAAASLMARGRFEAALRVMESPSDPSGRTGRPSSKTQAHFVRLARATEEAEIALQVERTRDAEQRVSGPKQKSVRERVAKQLSLSLQSVSNDWAYARRVGFIPTITRAKLIRVAAAFVSAHPGWRQARDERGRFRPYSKFVSAPREESVRAVRALSFVTKRHEAESLIDAACEAGLLPPSASKQAKIK